MSDEIKNALTAKEWCDFGPSAQDGVFTVVRGRHGSAALALYGQPFGFTREDVKAVLRAAILLKEWVPNGEGEVAGLRSLADRLKALLPPEGE